MVISRQISATDCKLDSILSGWQHVKCGSDYNSIIALHYTQDEHISFWNCFIDRILS
jgi:hypothetical protein